MIARESRLAFIDCVNQIERCVDELGFIHDERPWFRGHASTSHLLMPSLFRDSTISKIGVTADAMKTGNQWAIQRILRLESDLFFDFQIRLGAARAEYASAWDVVFAMRHYGLPTRTLDWTETLGVAVYFAVAGLQADSEPAIWVLNPYSMNAKSWGARDTVLPKYLASKLLGDPDMDYEDMLGYAQQHKLATLPVATIPSRANARMQAQAGFFTVHGQKFLPMESLSEFDDSVMRRVVLPPLAVPAAQAFCNEFGLTSRVLFPGVEGLAREMQDRFKA
jgi:hypothetical protein